MKLFMSSPMWRLLYHPQKAKSKKQKARSKKVLVIYCQLFSNQKEGYLI